MPGSQARGLFNRDSGHQEQVDFRAYFLDQKPQLDAALQFGHSIHPAFIDIQQIVPKNIVAVHRSQRKAVSNNTGLDVGIDQYTNK